MTASMVTSAAMIAYICLMWWLWSRGRSRRGCEDGAHGPEEQRTQDDGGSTETAAEAVADAVDRLSVRAEDLLFGLLLTGRIDRAQYREQVARLAHRDDPAD